MRVSADLRKSVYPGISRNDNLWSGLVPRMLRSVIIARTRVCDAPWLAAWCAADPGSIESDGSRLRGAAQERRTASGTRCSCRPRVVRSKREYKCQDQGKSGRRAPLARHGERGRRRTRQDQISLEAWKPGRAWKPVKLRTARIRTERRKLVSSAGPIFGKSELFSKMRSSRLT
jgi:hypothetical protein